MIEEKQKKTKWFLEGNLKLRQQEFDDGRIGIWVSLHEFNVCFTMIMFDFIEWCRDIHIDLEVDMSWNNHRGFVAESKDALLLRSEVKRFLDIHNIQPSEDDEKLPDDEWY